MKDEINLSETLPDGSPRYNKLSSGAIVDKTINRIVAREITSEEARTLVNKRWDSWRNAAASAMLKEVQALDPSVKTEQEAWAFLFAKQFVAFLDAEKPRGDDLIKFGQIVGAMPTIADSKPQAIESEDNSKVVIALKGLIEAITKNIEEDKPEVIEGEVR